MVRFGQTDVVLYLCLCYDLSLTHCTSSLPPQVVSSLSSPASPASQGLFCYLSTTPRPPCSPPVSSPPLRVSSSSNAHSRHSRPPRTPPRARVTASRLRTHPRSSQATMTLRFPLNPHSTTRRTLTRRASRLARSPIWSMEALVVDLAVSPWAHSPFLRRLSSIRSRLEGQECASWCPSVASCHEGEFFWEKYGIKLCVFSMVSISEYVAKHHRSKS
jgi:hypothetical protein